MSKHTPGPWVAEFEETYNVRGPDEGRVAICMNLKGRYGLGGRRTGAESAANARLIAAAPDLLETLRELVDGMPDVEDSEGRVLFRARAAIAKATGEQQ
jgi:hypothetical protein